MRWFMSEGIVLGPGVFSFLDSWSTRTHLKHPLYQEQLVMRTAALDSSLVKSMCWATFLFVCLEKFLATERLNNFFEAIQENDWTLPRLKCAPIMLRTPTFRSWLEPDCSSATTDDVDQKQVVILVVGNKERDKIGIVESLTRDGAWDTRTTAGVRISTCKSTARIVVDTTPLENKVGKSPTAIARRWISRNALRRILPGKLVVVVCVITCQVRNSCKWEMFSYHNCWVDVLGLIFKDHKTAIMMLVNTEGNENLFPDTKSVIEHFVVEHEFSTKNITYSNLKEGDDSFRRIIEESIRLSKIPFEGKLYRIQSLLTAPSKRRTPRTETDPVTEEMRYKNAKKATCPTVSPFLMKYGSSETERFGPWGPERVILFGRTGSGKSTLAQMLTLGTLDIHNKQFTSNSGIRGGTYELEHGEGRGWYVLDTPGFGEPKGPESTISTQEAGRKIKKAVRLVEGIFSHYIFVVKKDRLDKLDKNLWEFFMLLFGEEIKQQFTVVVSNADEEWVQDNIHTLKECFKGCESFLNAEFPPVQSDEEWERDYQEIRKESLTLLEEKLAELGRSDMVCTYGKHSKMHVRNEMERANVDLGIEKDLRIKFLNGGADICFAVSSFLSRLTSPICELTSLLTVDEDITVLPS